MTTKTKHETVKTVWEAWSYDVWGNAKDGYDVNDRHCFNRAVAIRCRVVTHNPGTEYEFKSASPSDYIIGLTMGFTGRIETDGDDTTIYVNRARDGYPLGELHCTSHDSLSPIRATTEDRR